MHIIVICDIFLKGLQIVQDVYALTQTYMYISNNGIIKPTAEIFTQTLENKQDAINDSKV